MVYNHRHKEEELKHQRSGLIGTIFILLIIIVLFGPMFFLIKSKISTEPNSIYSASLECGLSSTGYLYKSYAHIMPMTTAQQNELIKDSDEFDYLRAIPTDNMYIIDFPLESQLVPELPNETIDTIFKSNDYEIVYTLNLNFLKGTTNSFSPNVVQQYQLFNETLSLQNKTMLYENYLSHNGTVMFNFSLPVLLMTFYSYPIMPTKSESQIYCMEFTARGKFAFVHRESASSLLATPTIRVMLYSSEVPAASEVFSSRVMATSIIGIYILIIFTFGEVLRERVLNSYEGLWIERMRHPEVLYQYIIAIEAFKLVEAYDKEYMMIEKLLDVVRSKETCIQMTNDIEEVSEEKNSSDDDAPPPPSPKQNQAPKQTPETPKQQTPETPKQQDQEPPKEQNQEPSKQESPKTVEFVNVDPKT